MPFSILCFVMCICITQGLHAYIIIRYVNPLRVYNIHRFSSCCTCVCHNKLTLQSSAQYCNVAYQCNRLYMQLAMVASVGAYKQELTLSSQSIIKLLQQLSQTYESKGRGLVF